MLILKGRIIGEERQVTFSIGEIRSVSWIDGKVCVGENIPVDIESITIAIEEYEDELVEFVEQCRQYSGDPVLTFWSDLT